MALVYLKACMMHNEVVLLTSPISSHACGILGIASASALSWACMNANILSSHPEMASKRQKAPTMVLKLRSCMRLTRQSINPDTILLRNLRNQFNLVEGWLRALVGIGITRNATKCHDNATVGFVQ